MRYRLMFPFEKKTFKTNLTPSTRANKQHHLETIGDGAKVEILKM